MEQPEQRLVVLHPYDAAWPGQFSVVADRIRAALGQRALRIEHVGSTAVPGLPAKPVIDVNVTVADARAEDDYRIALKSAGARFHHREPDWFEHRLFKVADPVANVHVFGRGCIELERMRRFRDWLIADQRDRALYAATKQALAARDWSTMQDYADAKTKVVVEILTRAMPGDRLPYRTSS